MLSDLTENKVSDIIEEDEKPESIMIKEHQALKNKTEDIEMKPISFEPKRQSVALSREDMLNNISMARATLQKSRLELDESDNFEDTEKDSSAERESPRKKTVRLSNEVVKTLHFEEDDTASETSIKSDKISPLKKTAFGETSYMKERKAKVIPSYLKDVSDGIKALMHDLVKPNADTLPFEAVGLDKSLKKNPSTCSTQIQANLMTSSQIDLNTELYSNPTSVYDFKAQAAFANEVATVDNGSNLSALKCPVRSFPETQINKASESVWPNESDMNTCRRQNQLLKKQTVVEEVLVFDHENPLKNVFLAPTSCAKVHRYNPISSDEAIGGTGQNCFSNITTNDKDIEVERVSMQYNVNSRGVLPHMHLQSGDVRDENITDVQSKTSTISKPMSIDQSTDVRMVEVKDIDINTSITMKGNKELLEATSSLTLVDDALTQNVFDIDIDTNTSHKSFTAIKQKSPVKIIYQIDECGIKTEKNDSDFTSTDEVTTELKEHKRKKRNYSSTKHKNTTLSDLDVTPKPTSKVQKMSNSPKNIIKTILDLHRTSPDKNKLTSNKIESIRDEEMLSPDKDHKKSPRRSNDKTGTTITVQRLITEYHIETSMDQRTLNKQIVEALTDQPGKAKAVNMDEASGLEPVCSFTSSKNVKEQDDNSISMSSRPVSVCSDKSANCVNWQTDLVNEVGSNNSMSECESSVNVVAKIDMLPFMGHECEWEWSCGDTWSFRLLHARLRLVVRLAHRHDNAARTCVRADTPVIAINVEIAQHDKKNPVASACVRFAAETMRYLCAARCAVAGAVPALVRRCAAVARLAARWGRAMHHARAHLAYTLTDDGRLALKVANIPLRSVWEVTMQLELVAEEGGAPSPRATAVRVSRVVAERGVPDAAVRALLGAVPADWGHAPATIWRIFKYLKNKTRDDDLLAA
ncbi:uncharacterized protein LOC115454280 isoform X2 [Manduca sexta]|uniref:uncharacterized protein LOC115454280 isoform X2 n=1 Tax=Manduca sexta TaxID=7130 RepID=UPI00188DC82F|nr:uncharacterized protein LOC115454280 isoform X2 [Manduca sexta]